MIKDYYKSLNLPYGYDLIDGILIENKSELDVVKRIFNLYVSGLYNLRDIVNELNSDNIKTRNGFNWNPIQVSRVLHNPFYCGYVKINGYIELGKHIGVIDKELFMECQEMVNKRRNGVPFDFDDYEKK